MPCFLKMFMVEYSLSLVTIKSQEVKGLPNIKSSIKRVEVTKSKTLKNTVRKSALKTAIKKCSEVIGSNDSSASSVLSTTAKSIDKAAARNILHKNTAARRKSRLARALNTASK